MGCENNSCFTNTLKVIEVLQNNVNNSCCDQNGCDKPYLGNKTIETCYNTRPVTFYTCNGSLFTVTLNDLETPSSIFRIEKVYDNCVKLLVLIPLEDPSQIEIYKSTGEYLTLNLDCICAIQCLEDTVVNLTC